MKKLLRLIGVSLSIVGFLNVKTATAQYSGTITVNGDIDKYYVVTFIDGASSSNLATELEIGRSNVHQDSSWRGALIAKFRYHVNNWGSGAEFIDADIREANSRVPAYGSFIAGWADASFNNGSANMVVWMRGKTTYKYYSNYITAPVVYDGVQNPVSYTPVAGGTTFGVKSAVDNSVNMYGMTYGNTAYFNGVGTNYFGGSLGIGTRATGQYKLAVNGDFKSKRVKVEQANWADFVFEPEYQLPSLAEVETYIKANKHLPDVPSAKEVTKEGVDLGEMNKILLQKIEELTLHLIEQEKRSAMQDDCIRSMREEIKKLKSSIDNH
ncbi:hypothetical protein [Chitinophaga pinensis]|uniref:Uncharacterized protein n=1 Tax=Chitinophaga pinensis (strain ATCC 43595 / DSM 2588 / LMG 13176 / NBRC 15968 / NCIMB 11800 / UQM 2034) TaxID=485918 RepID=A0A979G783_CHIPD|nr:hypothetical protein [Chitinophaga pinensis]ACU62080.1 hypothetical protein Cpin_4639 [Chitinophaga pinensis DSM 2588]